MTQEQRITAALQTVGADVKALLSKQGNLSTLSTTEKSNLVLAINEINAGLNALAGGGAVVDDAATSSSTKTYSINKIKLSIQTLKDDLLGGVPAAAFDTLKEIADYITGDESATSALVAAVAKRVSVEVQSFSTPEKTQARANIAAYGAAEIGNPDTDFVTVYNTAKA